MPVVPVARSSATFGVPAVQGGTFSTACGRGSVLVLEAKPVVAEAVRDVLRHEGYETRSVQTYAAGRAWLVDLTPSLVIADLALPDLSGVELCRHLRASSQAGIMVIARADDEDACAQALYAGADDYVITPFTTKTLLARIGALLRRAKTPSDDVVSAGDISVDLQTRAVTVAGRETRLRPHEFNLFVHLVRRPSQVQSYRSLLAAVWGPSVQLRPHYVRMCVAHLRRQIEPIPSRPRYLLTERAVGYRLEPCGRHDAPSGRCA